MAEAPSTIQVDIVSAEGEIFSGPAKMVFAPASMGEIGPCTTGAGVGAGT